MINEKNGPDFFLKLNCYVVVEKLVRFYSFISALINKKPQILEDNFKSISKKKLKRFKSLKDPKLAAAKFL